MSNSSWPHGLQHTRLPCPSPTPRACSNSCPSIQWCHPTISSFVISFSSCLQFFPASGSFSSEFVLCIKWPNYWSFNFSISPSNEYLGLIFFRIDWFHLLVGTLMSLLQYHSSKASILQHSAFSMVQLSHPYMTTGKTIALTIQTFVSKVIFYPNLSQILFEVVTILCVVLMKRTSFHYRNYGGQISLLMWHVYQLGKLMLSPRVMLGSDLGKG